ncbi:EAL domain-containing protein [Methylovorus menthalis]|uniref:EAL domain-containing protein n=1 Tax=Methylovorus menthalis TaxID=1002227 RepID=UPI001E5D2AA6|nr:EAL domain-containing protein [Methylovorus menthalis]MCB4810263.1 EAL domain-containing protein [Methylovorus menthalis]
MQQSGSETSSAAAPPEDAEVTLSLICQWAAVLFEHLQDKVALYNLNAETLYINPMLKAHLPAHWGGVADVVMHSFFWRYRETLEGVIKTGRPDSCLAHYTLGDKEVCDLVNFSPLRDADGMLMGVLAIGRQTDQRDFEEGVEIRRREQYQRAVLDNFPFIVWLKDKQSRFLSMNSAFSKMFGLQNADEMIGKTDFDIFPEAMAQGYVEDDKEVLASGNIKMLVEPIRKSDGEMHWAETYKSPVVIDGEVIGTVGFARDITAERRLEAEIIRRENEYSMLVQNLPLTIVRYDRECRRVFVNSYCAMRDSLQQQVSQVMGKSPVEYWSGNIINITAEDYQKRILNVMDSGEPDNLELVTQYGDEQLVHLVRIVPERSASGELIGAMTVASDVTENSRYRKRIEQLAYHDILTELPNRLLFNQQLQLLIEQVKTQTHGFCLLFIDLDNFKTINDTLGHSVGDKLLIEVSRRISQLLGKDDMLARMGGDEFAISLPHCLSRLDAALLAARIIDALNVPFEVSSIKFFVSASMGIAFYPEDSSHLDDLLKHADLAMYHAKRQGRNNFQFYNQELTVNAAERLLMENLLRQALAKGELQLYYQPIIELATGEMYGAEALLRWNSYDLGMVGPDKFIPIAEERGMIVEIGRWVLREGCRTAVAWNALRSQPYVLAINLSSRQFMQQDFLTMITNCLQETGCHPQWLKFEITESLLLHDSDHIRQTLEALHSIGIAIAIDDFGTGYSALGYLNKFPVSQVKIDRSFISDIATNTESALLVKAIIAMADSLGKDLVAEGVETAEQADLLSLLGCQYVQGYYYGRPMPLETFNLSLR